jgi:hypothetical protein
MEKLDLTSLVVSVDAARPDNWMMADSRVISPSIVERAIRLALDQGWRPGLREVPLCFHCKVLNEQSMA